MDEKEEEHYIDHEVRIRQLESTDQRVIGLLRWILGTVVASVVIPVLLSKLGF